MRGASSVELTLSDEGVVAKNFESFEIKADLVKLGELYQIKLEAGESSEVVNLLVSQRYKPIIAQDSVPLTLTF